MKKPTVVPAWQDALKSSCLRCGFRLALTRAMLEFLCAVADDVSWDRSSMGSSAAYPDNFLATSRSLVKRGLVEFKPDDERAAAKHREAKTWEQLHGWTHYRLTPGGACVVELLKLTGLFVEAEAANYKKAKPTV